ncbi:hypothetical protein T4C_2234 [Trichinella pseudospiralis]|uniref:Uncharacterized protein n=1 Tax=Trichinella pseudospiralis TaxID=6337 RepID=A0A0V1JPD0_TRIPS|nr:hypothetical protein T4C_2234 [Trichinella pseudospiralis]
MSLRGHCIAELTMPVKTFHPVPPQGMVIEQEKCKLASKRKRASVQAAKLTNVQASKQAFNTTKKILQHLISSDLEFKQ